MRTSSLKCKDQTLFGFVFEDTNEGIEGHTIQRLKEKGQDGK